MKYDPVKLAAVVDRVDALAERIDYLAAERMDSPLITRRADDWNEEHHPRGPDGKFVEGAGAAGAAAKEYLAKQAKDGKKATPQGMMQHLLLNGGITKAEIWDTAKANFEMAPHLNNYVSAVLATMKKKGIDVAEPPKPVKGGAPAPKKEKEKAEDDGKAKDLTAGEIESTNDAAAAWDETIDDIKSQQDVDDTLAGLDYAAGKGYITDAQAEGLKKKLGIKAKEVKEAGKPPETAHSKKEAAAFSKTIDGIDSQGDLDDTAADIDYALTKGFITADQHAALQQQIKEKGQALAAKPAAKPGAESGPPDLPEPNASPVQQYMHDIANDPSISQEAKLAQLQNAYEMASDGSSNQNYALSLIQKLGGSQPAPGKPAAAAEGPKIPEPNDADSSTQKFIQQIANDPGMSNQDKIDEITTELAAMKYEPNQEYAKTLLAALGAKPAGTVQPAAAPGVGIPEPDDSLSQEFLHGIATSDKLSTAEKLAQIQTEGAKFKSPDSQAYAAQLTAALSSAPAAAPGGAAGTPSVATPGTLPKPANPHQEEMHWMVTGNTYSLGEKLKYLNGLQPTPENQAYKQQALAMVEAQKAKAEGKISAKAGKAAATPKGLPAPKGQGQDDLHWVATQSSMDPATKLEYIKNATVKPGDEAYKQKVVEHIAAQVAANPPPPAPPPPPPPPPPKPLAQTHALTTELADLKTKWKGMTAQNKPPVDALAQQLDKALSMATDQDQAQALSQITPIPNPIGLGQQSANEFLAKAQTAAGIAPTTPGTPVNAPLSKSLPKGPGKKLQSEIFHALHDSPANFHDGVYKLDGANGKIRSRMKLDTDLIPKDQYAKITAAYGEDRGNGMTQAVDQAMVQYQPHSYDKLDQATKDAIDSYQGTGYGGMNGALLGGSEGSGKTKEKIQLIKKAIANSVIPADTPAFRGMHASLKDLSGFDDPAKAVGRAFVHKNFASISRSQDTARSFGDQVMLKFTMPAGTPGLVMRKQNWEREIMLNANSVFRIDKVEQIANSSGTSAKHLVHVTYMGTKEDA